ncbi:MAG: hypothetical protein V7K47_02415 [Nostoc sp.]
MTLANKQANQLIFINKDGEKSLKNLQFWTLKNNQAYFIIYSAAIEDYDRFLPTVEKMNSGIFFTYQSFILIIPVDLS